MADDSPWMKNVHTDSKGRMYCKAHRREVCHVCCVDHRFCNELVDADEDVDIDALNEKHDALQETEHAAMVQQHVIQGGRGPVTLGTAEAQELYDAAASRPGQHACAHCGARGDKLLICSRCKAARYCGTECQTADWKSHKKGCKEAATKASRPELIGWDELEALGGETAEGRVLEVKIMAVPYHFYTRFRSTGKDHKGELREISIHCALPEGLTLGRIMRWRNPRYHTCPGGAGIGGAWIFDQDADNVDTVAA